MSSRRAQHTRSAAIRARIGAARVACVGTAVFGVARRRVDRRVRRIIGGIVGSGLGLVGIDPWAGGAELVPIPFLLSARECGYEDQRYCQPLHVSANSNERAVRDLAMMRARERGLGASIDARWSLEGGPTSYLRRRAPAQSA